MDVDEAGCDDGAARVELALSREPRSDSGDPSVLDEDVRLDTGGARSIEDHSSTNHDRRHGTSPLRHVPQRLRVGTFG
jgi:hypothetical protein